jgi:hypothetical protein
MKCSEQNGKEELLEFNLLLISSKSHDRSFGIATRLRAGRQGF